ncbi:NifU family protein [[Mycobacterium] kokjensenii]|uniref:NifU family protein n=1 Tax=[Mycobacterium] kokjensenii TaxID=3064287 RepID=A0ABM9LH88_9MYCO|nr:NifU family protein [Mycolicibacter sp. MU0083]CAJ1499010.1 NifU family protein [Mycolicibacter sp. MU0083]
MIPMHATDTGDPRRVRWVITGARLPAHGRVRHAPDRLGRLQADGVIEEMTVDGSGIVITLDPRHGWRACGEQIRVALDEALRRPGDWEVDASDRSGEIARVSAELLDGPIGALAASHGGAIELLEVTGDRVRVQLHGACRGCSASSSTLHDRLQRELRRRFGDAVTVSAQHSVAALSVGRRLLTLFVR